MKIVKEAVLNEAKEKLPVSFLTDFISKGWEEVGYLKADIEAIKEAYSGTGKIEELIQGLIDAYLVCIGQMELHLNDKNYLDYPEDSGLAKKESLSEAVELKVEADKIEIETEPETVVNIDETGDKITIEEPVEAPCEGPACDIPPAEVEIEPVIDDNPLDKPFEFDAPEAEGVRKFEKPEVADFFVDFDDPVGEPVSEKDLYGEGEDAAIGRNPEEEKTEEDK